MGFLVDQPRDSIALLWLEASKGTSRDASQIFDHIAQVHPWLEYIPSHCFADKLSYLERDSFLTCFSTGNIAVVNCLLFLGVSTKHRDEYYWPLGQAIQSGSYVTVEFLLDNGADSDFETPKKSKLEFLRNHKKIKPDALRHACQFGSVEMYQLLLSRGAKPASELDKGETYMHFAIRGRNLPMAQYLLSQGYRVPRGSLHLVREEVSSYTGMQGESSLPSLDLFQFLLDNGASALEADEQGLTSICVVVTHLTDTWGKKSLCDNDQMAIEMMQLLKAHGAKISDLVTKENCVDSLYKGEPEFLHFAFNQPGCQNISVSTMYSLLIGASSLSNAAMFDILLPRLARAMNISALDEWPNHPERNMDLVYMVFRDWSGTKGRDKCILLKKLLSLNGNVGSRNPCVLALGNSRFQDMESLPLLLRHGMSCMQSELGQTALHGACYRGHLSMVRMLLEAGADVNAKDAEGITSFQEAIQNAAYDSQPYGAIIELLLKYGAKVERHPRGNGALDQIPSIREVLERYVSPAELEILLS